MVDALSNDDTAIAFKFVILRKISKMRGLDLLLWRQVSRGFAKSGERGRGLLSK